MVRAVIRGGYGSLFDFGIVISEEVGAVNARHLTLWQAVLMIGRFVPDREHAFSIQHV